MSDDEVTLIVRVRDDIWKWEFSHELASKLRLGPILRDVDPDELKLSLTQAIGSEPVRGTEEELEE